MVSLCHVVSTWAVNNGVGWGGSRLREGAIPPLLPIMVFIRLHGDPEKPASVHPPGDTRSLPPARPGRKRGEGAGRGGTDGLGTKVAFLALAGL
jgi:hypothetical protein